MFSRLRTIIGNSRGATAIEYGLIVSLIVIAIIGGMQLFASRTISMWGNVTAAVTNAS